MNLSIYMDELRLALRLGDNFASKLAIFRDFLGYHFANRIGKSYSGDAAPIKSYSVNLAGRSIKLRLRPRGGDFYVLHEIFGRGLFAVEKEISKHFDLSTVRNFVDLGANVGLVSLYYATILPNAKFVCLEPDHGNFQLMSENLSWLKDRGIFIEGAAADTSGYHSFDNSGQSYRKRLSGDGNIKVRAYTIPELMSAAQIQEIDIIKIDIEGGEKQILEGNLDWLAGTRAILIELHDGFSEEDLVGILTPLGFKLKRLDVGENFLAIRA